MPIDLPALAIKDNFGCDLYTKSVGDLYLSLVPHFEALALPSPVERATQKPTPMIYTKNHVCQYRTHIRCMYTNGKHGMFIINIP